MTLLLHIIAVFLYCIRARLCHQLRTTGPQAAKQSDQCTHVVRLQIKFKETLKLDVDSAIPKDRLADCHFGLVRALFSSLRAHTDARCIFSRMLIEPALSFNFQHQVLLTYSLQESAVHAHTLGSFIEAALGIHNISTSSIVYESALSLTLSTRLHVAG